MPVDYAGATFDLLTGTLDVFLAGCSLNCKGCQNPELQLKSANVLPKENLTFLLKNPMVKTLRIMGGEPTEHEGLQKVIDLAVSRDTTVWLFTGLEELPTILRGVDYVKYGRYEEGLPSYTIKKFDLLLASDNQKVIDYTSSPPTTYRSTN